jgi:hypothetical protein
MKSQSRDGVQNSSSTDNIYANKPAWESKVNTVATDFSPRTFSKLDSKNGSEISLNLIDRLKNRTRNQAIPKKSKSALDGLKL